MTNTDKIISLLDEKIYPKQSVSVIEKIKNLSVGKNLQLKTTAEANKHSPKNSAKNLYLKIPKTKNTINDENNK